MSTTIEDTAETATEEFETNDSVIDIVGIGDTVVTIAQVGGLFTTAVIFTGLQIIADILLLLADAALGFTKANAGRGTLLELRDENAAAIDGIVHGEVR